MRCAHAVVRPIARLLCGQSLLPEVLGYDEGDIKLRSLREPLDLPGELVRMPEIVRVDHRDQFTMRRRDPVVAGRCRSPVATTDDAYRLAERLRQVSAA